MSAPAPVDAPSGPAFELKGTNFTLPVLRLLSTDTDAITRELADKLAEAPQLLQHAPLVIDLQGLQGTATSVDFALLVGLLRSNGFIPVGISGGTEEQNTLAATMELAVLSRGSLKIERPARPARREAAAPVSAPGRLVTQPVRSGQRVYAPGGDLVVVGPVGAGAEVFADGNVHIYGTLRGRALAGVKGAGEARIFCHALDAELVSIAGNYRDRKSVV